VAVLGASQQGGGTQQSAGNQPPANWYPDPHNPAYVRYWDGAAWTGLRHPAAAGTVPIPGSLRAPARVVAVLLVVFAALTIISIPSGWAERNLVARIADNPAFVIGAEVKASDQRQVLLGNAQLLLYLGTGIAFLVWFHRAYRDPVLDRGWVRFSSGWAIGSWFVPFLNLVRPKQIMDDLWRASEPPVDDTAGPQPRVPALIHAWWVLFLAMVVAGQIGFQLAWNAETVEDFQGLSTFLLVSDVMALLASIVTLLVVMRLTQRILARGELAAGGSAT
jgi:Domain of unknown function (DUF4328)/Protein of unknown function (DUF2510)